MKFDVTKDDALAIIQVLGKLPTEANAYPLWVNLNNQFQQQQIEPVVAPEPTLKEGEPV